METGNGDLGSYLCVGNPWITGCSTRSWIPVKPARTGLAWHWQRRQERLDKRRWGNHHKTIHKTITKPSQNHHSQHLHSPLRAPALSSDTRQKCLKFQPFTGIQYSSVCCATCTHRRYFRKFGSIERLFGGHGWPRERHDKTKSTAGKEQLSQARAHLFNHSPRARTAAGQANKILN